jgi:23S rRNA (guanine2445-N2)-methyltransferase / 23S rRNA (guanine2069-N7)-methyltransferase
MPRSARMALLASDDALLQRLGLSPEGRSVTRRGSADGVLCACDLGATAANVASVALRSGVTVEVALAASEQFARRLEKNLRLRRKWARREGVSCYRLYDADLPDYALSIDLFQASEREGVARDRVSASDRASARDRGLWLVVSEYAAPKEIDPTRARLRLEDACAIAAAALDASPQNVYVRTRTRAKGGSQYAELGGRSTGAHLVDEGGLVFEVDFAAALDVGLFLDTRPVRALVRDELRRRVQMGERPRFLNLFAYTGSATCYAASGGAGKTTTVDLSRTYLDWARRNMARNGFDGAAHEFVQADVLAWLDEARRAEKRWDVIYLDPPTFSNSSRMRDASFDVQRDHVRLLANTSALLAPGGVCVFCCNLRDFKPDLEALAAQGVRIEDITARTISEDFARNPKIHHCYLVRRS